MSSRLALAMSASAFAVALLGATPVGQALTSALPRNSVGPLQLKRNAVGPQKVAPNAIRTAHVLNGSLLAADFKPGQLPAGAKGDKGDPGPPGASEYQLVAQQKSVVNSTSNFDTVNCPAGKKAVGGGITSSPVSATQGPFVYFSRPTAPGTGWTAGTVRTAAGGWNIVVYAICVKVT
jgi:hypothetical protein